MRALTVGCGHHAPQGNAGQLALEVDNRWQVHHGFDLPQNVPRSHPDQRQGNHLVDQGGTARQILRLNLAAGKMPDGRQPLAPTNTSQPDLLVVLRGAWDGATPHHGLPVFSAGPPACWSLGASGG